MNCRHCGRSKANRPRGLCWSCYYAAGVRDLYPPTSKFARRGVLDFNGRASEARPTPYFPGSPEKLAALEDRAAAGAQLFHRLDGPHMLADPAS